MAHAEPPTLGVHERGAARPAPRTPCGGCAISVTLACMQGWQSLRHSRRQRCRSGVTAPVTHTHSSDVKCGPQSAARLCRSRYRAQVGARGTFTDGTPSCILPVYGTERVLGPIGERSPESAFSSHSALTARGRNSDFVIFTLGFRSFANKFAGSSVSQGSVMHSLPRRSAPPRPAARRCSESERVSPSRRVRARRASIAARRIR